MIRFLAPLCLIPLSAAAEVPHVMTDIAPVYSLVSQVMGDLGQPDLLLPPGADPHSFALRPSDAQRLTQADMVFWIGEGLTPWLEEPLATLAPNAMQREFLATEGWEKLAPRDMHHAEEGEDEDADHDDHDDHGDVDPHAWLDPTIAAYWVAIIAQDLIAHDPDHADTYRSNAEVAVARIEKIDSQNAQALSDVVGIPYILPHDGYQYFEHRYGLTPADAIAGIDGRTPGPAQLADIRAKLAAGNIHCVFNDFEVTERTSAVVTEGTGVKTATLDGLGSTLPANGALYQDLLTNLMASFYDCLT